MKIDKEIIKSIYPNHRKVTTKLINDLGIDCVSYDQYVITNNNIFIKNFWSKLNEEQKTGLFLTQLVEHNNDIDDLKNRLSSIEEKLLNLKITYNPYSY